MENIVTVKFPFSSLSEILVLVMIELVILLKDSFSSLRYFLQLSLHFLTFHLRRVWAEFEISTGEEEEEDDDDDQKKQSKTREQKKGLKTKNVDHGDVKLCIEEVKDVMERLLVEENYLSDEELFEEEVSLEEVREAFDVFDENKDGFIDAGEVQRVLCALMGTSMEASEKECKSMITAFDQDGDGRIDFNEFVEIMENSFR